MHLIEILGPGCPRCDKATAEIRAVVERNHCEADVRHVTDPFEIVARGALFSIPVVLIDGVLVSRGRVPSRKDIERWLDVGSEVPVEASGWRGMGFFLFVLVASLLFDRLVFHPLPPAPMAPSVWIGLGPLGVGGLALVVLAQTAAPMWGDAAAVVTTLSLIVATALWGFGLWWLAASVVLLVAYLRRGPLPYGLGWWAFTFPLGALTASTLALARGWHAGALEAIGVILFVALLVAWVIVSGGTLGAVRSGAAWRR